MTVEELRERCRLWQHRLRLLDWDVKVEIKRQRDMIHPEGKAGEVEMVLEQRMAWITLRDMVDIAPEDQDENDLEYSLVHELLHLWTEPLGLPDDGPKKIAEEQMLNSLCRAFVKLDREGKR